jgi:hypothetical protein
MNNRDPYVYKTEDYGRTWTAITSGIPRSMLSYAHCVREDPVRPGLLYLGTENALYVSFDDGANWRPLQTNLPHAPVHWLVVQEQFGDLVVATYGRGFWIMDDITPLQQLTDEVLSGDAHLFAPRPAYRFRTFSYTMTRPQDPSAGRNPPYGASLSYFLKAAPQSQVSLTIRDKDGVEVKTLTGSKDPGINRVWWDLRWESSKSVRLRTPALLPPPTPPGSEGWRLLGGAGGVRPLAAPGTYTVILKVGDKEFTRTLEIRHDPNSGGGVEDVKAQERMLLELRRDSNAAADLVNAVEGIRKQLQDLILALKQGSAVPNSAELAASASALERKLTDFEEQLIQVRVPGGRQNATRFGTRFYDKLGALAVDVSTSDFKPTTQAIAVHTMYKARLAALRKELDDLVGGDLAALNRSLEGKGIPHVIP